MKGLFRLNLSMMAAQKRDLLLLVILLPALGMSGIMDSPWGFIIPIASVMWTTISINTVFLEMQPNAQSYVFALPFTAKEYALEKILLSSGISFLISLVLSMAALCFHEDLEETAVLAGAANLIAVMITAVELPGYLYFGPEKAKYIVILIWAVVMGGGYALIKWISPEVLQTLGSISGWILAAAALLILAVSWWITVLVLKKKEF